MPLPTWMPRPSVPRAALVLAFVSATLVTLVAAYLRPSGDPAAAPPSQAVATIHGYEVVRAYPHDPEAFTQGLIYREGLLYESTGLTGRSSLRKVRLETGEVIQRRRVDDRYFAEGLTDWGGTLLQLTPMRKVPTVRSALARIGDFESVFAVFGRRLGVNIGSRYDLASFEPQSTFTYRDEGWGLTHDGRRLIMSDGTATLRFLDPDTFRELGRVQVTDRGRPVNYLNELELVKGDIYANVWHESRIARIQPDSGQVTGWIDLTGLELRMTPAPDDAEGAVLNGIAYDAAGDRLFVTGKLWSRLFEIRLRQTGPPRRSPAGVGDTPRPR